MSLYLNHSKVNRTITEFFLVDADFSAGEKFEVSILSSF